MAFDDFPLDSDPDDFLGQWLDLVRQYFPNFEPAEGSLTYRNAAALLTLLAVGIDVAANVPAEIFRTAGESLFNIRPRDGIQARADTTWTVRDGAGYSIPAGALLSVDGALFETTDDINVAPTVTVVTPVPIVALDVGQAGSNLGAPGQVIVLEEAMEFVVTVELLSATTGGEDSETNEEYMDRLREELQLLTTTPILPGDLAKLARTVTGVWRVAVIDLYDADTDTPNSPGHATLVLIDEAGEAVPVLTKDEVNALVTAGNRRLINAIIHVIDPTYTPVDITVDGIAYPDAVPADVAAAVETALNDFLDAGAWGLPRTGESREWINKTVVSLYDIAGAVDQVEGFDRATNIQIGLNGGAQASADANLPGVAPLPRVGAVVVNVVAP